MTQIVKCLGTTGLVKVYCRRNDRRRISQIKVMDKEEKIQTVARRAKMYWRCSVCRKLKEECEIKRYITDMCNGKKWGGGEGERRDRRGRRDRRDRERNI